MHRNYILAVCVSSLVACGGADPKPTQDPSTTSGVVTTDPTMPDKTVSDDATPVSNMSGPTTPASTSGSQPAPAAGTTTIDNPGAADQTSAADNTKVNDRDRHGGLTPMDQGNSASETQITAAIRKSIVANKSLSFTAKNVKIITNGTKVTLRGPVKNDQEKSTIEAAAKQAAGVTTVDDQLEIKK